MVYFVALAAIVAVTMFGLGGISARFGANTQPPLGAQGAQQAGANVAPGSPGSPGVAPTADLGQAIPTIALPGSSNPTGAAAIDTPLIPIPTSTPMPPLPVLAVQPTQPAPSDGASTDAALVVSQIYTPLEAQGGIVSGEASTPFHLVEPGDTLSGIAQQLGVDVNALVSVNNLVDDLIYPGQMLYLPPVGGGQGQPATETQPQPPQQPAEPPATPGEQEVPAPTPPGADVPQVPGMPDMPDMPNTGINKKR